ncbi:MFS transporter [Pseudonocardia abyssalis]|uniref:MFS transporter n=1 Tax=Pseudonocardia abyssalis TaxID=2792008 RepID=A0ABS6UXT4_9PSEU|nr:MFS transporter [Pseudonocardia abyssalis]MBW0114841.1 MFS transporter [Pseudonocardia abyssalis]MBW0137031.1 MFS transporter [Pseudonocardia abyssalis]
MSESVLHSAPDVTAPSGRARTRAVVAVAVGNLLEWYDFAVYAGMAALLATLFFPSDDPIASLLASFSVFAVGFALRPVGAIVFGRMADRHGRRPTLLVVITLMGVATVLIGVMPTYATAGVWGAVLLVLARSAQGLSVGGEFSASTAFLVEFAPADRRGFYGSLAYLTACLGSFLGLGVVTVVRSLSSPDFLVTWGWRIPFLLSFPLLAIGLYIRLKVEESPAFARTAAGPDVSPVTESVRSQKRGMAVLFGITIGFAVGSYTVLAFVLGYLTTVLGYPPADAAAAVLISTLIGSLTIPLFGHLSDRIGRRPVLVAGCVGLAAAAFPAYALMGLGGIVAAVGGQLLIWVFMAMLCGACPAAFSELFPTRLRTTAVGVSYSFALALFGGTTPLVSTWLVGATGSTLAPAWFLLVTAAVSAAAALRLRETAREALPA